MEGQEFGNGGHPTEENAVITPPSVEADCQKGPGSTRVWNDLL